MPGVSNFNLKTLEARRYQAPQARPMQVRIDNNLSVTAIEADGADKARVEFSYTASYGALGVIKIDGEFRFEDERVAATLAQWQEKRQMPGDVASQLHTSIMQACVPEAVLLAKSVRLPPPIPMPQIRFQQKGASAKADVESDPAVS